MRRKVDLALMSGSGLQLLELEQIREHPDTQPRELLSAQAVEEYSDDMSARADGVILNKQGVPWPSIVVFASPTEAGTYWLADGYHRLAAARRAGLKTIQVDQRDGELRDAILYSAGVNASHGQRRSRADARRAVRRLLEDKEWVEWSDVRIAHACHVSSPTVASVRAQLEQAGAIEPHVRRMGADGRVQYTRLQGRRAAPPPDEGQERPTTPGGRPAVPASRQTTARWDELARLSGSQYAVAVCHWETSEHLRLVAERGLELLGQDGALVVPLPQGDQLASLIIAIEGKKRERGVRGPVVVISGGQTALVLWVGAERTVPGTVASLADLIARMAGAGSVLHISTEGGGPAL